MRSLAILALLLCLTTGCEESVDAVLPTDRAFTLYGHLDPGKDRQAIRVFPIEGTLELTGTAPLDASVVLTAPDGTTAAFRDSVVTFWDGSRGHVYHADYRPDFGTLYRLKATDTEGRVTEVLVRTPVRATMSLSEPTGVRGNVRMPVRFENAPRILSPRVIYTFESPRAPLPITIPVVYDESIRQDGEVWEMVVDLSRDIGVLYTVTGLQPGQDPLYLTAMHVEAFVATADWTPPGGRFDSELLVQPGVFSNVENGFGFVGAGYLEGETFLPDPAILDLAGFAIDDGSQAGM